MVCGARDRRMRRLADGSGSVRYFSDLDRAGLALQVANTVEAHVPRPLRARCGSGLGQALGSVQATRRRPDVGDEAGLIAGIRITGASV